MIHDSDQHIETLSSGLRIGACGWRHAGWCRGFYPDDLPEDWQLSYYANEFPTVLVPADYWQGDVGAEPLLDEVPDSFMFFLQCSIDSPSLDDLLAVGEQLGEQFGGVLMDAPPPHRNGKIYSFQATGNPQQGIWMPENSASSGIGMVSLRQEDIKTWRRWLEQFQQASNGNLTALLVSDEEPDMHRLQQLKTLAELMGL